ncbi:NACHT domain-containing protein [Streptomyces sp. NPDC058644]|uniref:NACHT domain-containing protein n=1 Tax=unclassified Streptomyces TaxID=2593676 RepID=UPI00365B0024
MEPVFTSLGARAASLAAGPLVNKILIAQTPGAGLTTTRTPLARRVAWGGKQSKITKKDVEKLVGKLVDKTISSDPELYDLKSECQPLAAALCDTLLTLGDLNMDDIQVVNLRHDGLARKLQESRPQARRELSEDSSHLYETILEICCLHILDFFSRRPEFAARTQIEAIGLLHEQDRKVLTLLERLPDPKSVDSLFEKQYAESVVRRYDELTIFGLDLKDSDSSWPLDTAYLSLETVLGGRYFKLKKQQLDLIFPSPADVSISSDNIPERVEKALSGRPRVLMRGLAGSGKTTLVQWLATSAARRNFQDDLADLNIFVPFVLPLRSLARDGSSDLPTPDQFLHAVGNMQAGAQPSGWAHRVMENGRGLLLIDGVDEVSAAYRSKTRNWLRNLLKEFPHTRCIVTARPSSIAEGWLAREKFTELALSPMNPKDIHVFVDRWHAAAKNRCSDPESLVELDLFATSLVEEIDTKPDLARLVTSPLMCALVCALHRDKRGRLPRGRKSLYEAALRMLLTERDDQRQIGDPEGVVLDEEDQVVLLQKIAYWLIRNGLVEVERDTAQRMVESTIPHMPSVQQMAKANRMSERIFGYLVTRSGLLREPSVDTVEFVHRTFQDYLGARAAVEGEDIPYLIKQAHNDQWEDVIRMAVAHCRPKERARLIKGIVERGDAEGKFKHRLYLLALICLEHSPELDAELQQLIQDKAGALIPPSTLEDADELAQVGPVLLELLPGPVGLTEEQACAVIRAAALVGGNGAMRAIAKYTSDKRHAVRRAIAGAWSRFDSIAYADAVLQHGSFPLTVTSIDQAIACNQLQVESVSCAGKGAVRDFAPSLPSDLKSLFVLEDDTSDFSKLARFRHLSELGLSACKGLSSLDQIPNACSGIESLQLATSPLRDFQALSTFSGLRSMFIVHNTEPLHISEMPELPQLATLALVGRFDVEQVPKKFSNLESLLIQLDTSIGSLEWLGNWPSLTHLQVKANDQAEWVTRGLGGAPNLEILSLRSILPAFFGADQLVQIVNCLPKLKKLELWWSSGQLAVVDVSYLTNRRQDLTLTISGAHEVRGADGFADGRLKII